MYRYRYCIYMYMYMYENWPKMDPSVIAGEQHVHILGDSKKSGGSNKYTLWHVNITCIHVHLQGIIYLGLHCTLRAKNASPAIQFHRYVAKNCNRSHKTRNYNVVSQTTPLGVVLEKNTRQYTCGATSYSFMLLPLNFPSYSFDKPCFSCSTCWWTFQLCRSGSRIWTAFESGCDMTSRAGR